MAAFPDVDILVNNLGIFEPKSFEEIPDEDWRRLFEVNVLEEVASLVAYVASPLASATTGAALRVDGGVVKSAF